MHKGGVADPTCSVKSAVTPVPVESAGVGVPEALVVGEPVYGSPVVPVYGALVTTIVCPSGVTAVPVYPPPVIPGPVYPSFVNPVPV